MTIDRFKKRLATVADLQAAARVLEWDQETYMPPGAAEVRAQQLATLKSLAHAHFVDPETEDLLADIETDGAKDDTTSALVRVARRDLERATRRPRELVERQALASSRAIEAWKEARAADDFATFAPHLNAIIDLAREEAHALGYDVHPYDALLEEYEPGATRTEVAELFANLRPELVDLVDAIADAPPIGDALVRASIPGNAQWAFGLEAARAVGYDFSRGRQDRSAHPFSTAFGPPFDVRITTRIDEEYFPTAFFGTLHEVGHALYEQGIDPDLARTPLADGTSLGVHESQARLWENLVGRSRPFWQWALPMARRHLGDRFEKVDADTVYRAVNRVEASLIRVEADEVTYSLHVMLRFELESAMLTGDLQVHDLPAAWNDKMQEYLGVTPPDDRRGCLQDIHWSLGAIGYFPTYALGSLMSVQLFNAAVQELGDVDEQMAHGQFEPLLEWLRRNVHRHGRMRSAADLMLEATGRPLSPEPWMAYARAKFSDVYGVQL